MHATAPAKYITMQVWEVDFFKRVSVTMNANSDHNEKLQGNKTNALE